MHLESLGLWVIIPLIVPATVAALLGVLALRGTKPDQRPDILHALAALTAALLLRDGRRK
jgi:hypothetical protein